MTHFIAVSNRKGGVGKTTISAMLAHSFSVWGNANVLVIDLDFQANASVILMGVKGWISAINDDRTVSDMLAAQLGFGNFQPYKYVTERVADIWRI